MGHLSTSPGDCHSLFLYINQQAAAIFCMDLIHSPPYNRWLICFPGLLDIEMKNVTAIVFNSRKMQYIYIVSQPKTGHTIFLLHVRFFK